MISSDLGFNGETFILAGSFSYDQLTFKSVNNQIKPGAAAFQVSLGIRF